MSQRRKFFKKTGHLLAAGFLAPSLFTTASGQGYSAHDDEGPFPDSDAELWPLIRRQFDLSPKMINLNNGGVSPHPISVQQAFETYTRLANQCPAYYLFREYEAKRPAIRSKLAALAGCPDDEIALCRNTTEALETVIMGLDLKPGDHIITTDQDYPHMRHALMQRQKRDGIEITWVRLPAPCEDTEQIVRLFETAIRPNSRAILFCHIINLTGQILPVKEISSMAHRHGLEVIVDGAHSFAHLNFKIPELGCDYFGTSLHKWLSAPFGTGMLWVKKEKIPKIWPLLACPWENDDLQGSINKFDHLGTRPYAAELAIETAIDFHQKIGSARKEGRLRFLKNYWAEQAISIPGVRLHTSLKDEWSCALATFSISDVSPNVISNRLLKEFQLFTTPIEHKQFSGIRVTPHLYTNLEELDRLVEAIRVIAKG